MCYNANTDCLVDRSKVYFAVGGSGAMVSAAALQQKIFLSIPLGAGMQSFHILPMPTQVSLLYYGFLPLSKVMNVGDC